MSRHLLSVAALTAALLLPAAADAAKRERVLVERETFSYSGVADCGTFAIEYAGDQRFKAWDIYEGGELVQTVFIQGFKETDTHSVTGATLPLHGSVRELCERVPPPRDVLALLSRHATFARALEPAVFFRGGGHQLLRRVGAGDQGLTGFFRFRARHARHHECHCNESGQRQRGDDQQTCAHRSPLIPLSRENELTMSANGGAASANHRTRARRRLPLLDAA